MPAAALIHPWESAISLWVRVYLDFPGPFMGKMFLIIFDSYSKRIGAYPMLIIKTSSTLRYLVFKSWDILYQPSELTMAFSFTIVKAVKVVIYDGKILPSLNFRLVLLNFLNKKQK